MTLQLEREFFRTAKDWLLSRWILMGNRVDRFTDHPSKVEWQLMELDCALELALIMEEAQNDSSRQA